ncbi:tumor necrosis factor receptor superfamily member 6 [Chroicocephalus ridibundus]|uniref:tumor necrosis factor receptor superfamily member 6 n=1 Tax=Chroicocephalus ridibundus TaxID=1192867 RepID=UPI002FDD7D3D
MPSPKPLGTWLGDPRTVPGIHKLPSRVREHGAHDTQEGPACPCPRPVTEGSRAQKCLGGRGGTGSRGRPGKRQLCPPPAAGPPAPPRSRAAAGRSRAVFTNMGGAGRGQGAGGSGQTGRGERLSLCRRALGSGSMARGLLPLFLVVVLITEMQCKNDTEALINILHNKLITRRIIAKRETNCNEDEYNLDDQCCKKCERGFVKNIKCPTDISKHCVPCQNGKEYIDHVNALDECFRCSSCDGTFNLEVATNCTPGQNTECTCVKNHFCNSAVPCDQCQECTICESGVIEKQCTSTSDTVCGIKAKTGFPWWATTLIIMLPLLGGAVALIHYVRRQKGFTIKGNLDEVVPKPDSSGENVPLIYADVDLSSHVAGIVEEMTLTEVKTFVRKHQVPEPVIDQTIRDNLNDTSEQKIKLFQAWYQRHGIKGAYGTLISSLRELKMCAAADKIEEKLRAAVLSCQEGGQSYSDETEQSKTCTQESRNSYNDSAELSKTFSGSLEET